MQDKSDFLTVDFLSLPSPGRPRTSTPDKKRSDAAERARRYRQRNKLSVLPGNDSSSINRVVNTHEIKLCNETEKDFVQIYNCARWLNDCYTPMEDGFFHPDSAHQAEYLTQWLQDAVIAIAERTGCVWANPPVNRDLYCFRDDDD